MPVDYINIIDRVWGHLKAGQRHQMHSRGLTLPVFGLRYYSAPGRRKERRRCIGTAGANAKINTSASPKIKKTNKRK